VKSAGSFIFSPFFSMCCVIHSLVVCRSMQIDNKMADGYNIETDNQRFTVQVVTEHSSTFGKNSHASALRKRAYLLSITQHSLVVKDATKLGFFRLIRIVISRTIHDESIAQFPSECELQRRNGVTLPNQYCNEKGFKEILYSARNVARKKKNNRCNKYRVITYGTDGGVSTEPIMMPYLTILPTSR